MNEYLKKLMSGYYNYTPPQTFMGNKMDHYSDNINTGANKMLSNYYNLGYEEPIGIISPDSVYVQPTRFYNDPKFETTFTKGKNSLLDFFRKNISNKMELPSYLAPKN